MLKLKAKCAQIQQAIGITKKEFVDCIEKAEVKNDMSLVIKRIFVPSFLLILLVMDFLFFTQFIVDICRFY